MFRLDKTPNRTTWPLHAAAHDGAGSARIEELLDEGHDPEDVDEYGMTVLHHAAAAGNADLCEYLIDSLGFQPDATNDQGMTALQMAAVKGREQAVKILVSKGADPNRKFPNGKSMAENLKRDKEGILEAVVSGISERMVGNAYVEVSAKKDNGPKP